MITPRIESRVGVNTPKVPYFLSRRVGGDVLRRGGNLFLNFLRVSTSHDCKKDERLRGTIVLMVHV
jgi:hypothetical protein